MSSRFTHDGACIRISFLFKTEQYLIMCINRILFIHSSVDDHAGCFPLSPIVSNAAVDVGWILLLKVFSSLALRTNIKTSLIEERHPQGT